MTKRNTVTTIRVAEARPANSLILRACDILQDSQFDRRDWRDDDHTRTLRTAITNGARLPPVLVWKDPDKADGAYVLLDGAYRLAAIAEAKGRNANVRAEVFAGTRCEAYRVACEANAKHGKPLTENERMNAAWGLTMQSEPRLTQLAIAEKMGVGRSSVQSMWRLWRKATEAGIAMPMTGSWKRDRLTLTGKEVTITEMTDEQRREEIGLVAKGFQKAAGRYVLFDTTVVAEAVSLAFNDSVLAAIIEYNLPCGDDEEGIDDFDARVRRFRAERSSRTQQTLEGLSTDPNPDF